MKQRVIPYGRQHITQADIEAVVDVLRGDYLTQGPKISEFEAAFAAYIGAAHAVTVSNGTAALHLCAMALGVRTGTKVITTPITFAASANCIRYCGGEVVFADIDPETYLLDLNAVRSLLESAPPGTYSGVIPVDFAGRAVDLEAWRGLADEHGLWIIEDSCHAPGGFFVDSTGTRQHCGNGRYADCSIFSFHPVKHIAAGEGGMITTRSPELAAKMAELRTHGIARDASTFMNPLEWAWGGEAYDNNYPGWYMEMQSLGFNYRLTDFQAALGLSQLQRAGEGLQRRHTIAKAYREAFHGHENIVDRNFEADEPLGEISHAHHLYVVETSQRNDLYMALRSEGILAQIHYIPTHLMPYYRTLGWKVGDLPHAERYYSRCISLPMYPTLTTEEQDAVISNTIS